MASFDEQHMRRALEIAKRGEGYVEPNPMVGCVIARDERVIAEGWHAKYGGAHAEAAALDATDDSITGATMYVTLEPCSHHGKTPPCADAVVNAGVGRVVIAQEDPFPQVAGRGIEKLKAAGIQVDVGLLGQAARELNEPYLTKIHKQRPWLIAKWAMTLDGKLASRTGNSQWISNESSREIVHRLRGRVDGILVGRETAIVDDPLLTARPAGPRVATRIVVDTNASLPLTSKLVQTSGEFPTLVAVGDAAPAKNQEALTAAGCKVVSCEGSNPEQRMDSLLKHLCAEGMTNVLVEGGGALLGSLFDQQLVDEVHVFVAPKVVGGSEATRIGGEGFEKMTEAFELRDPHTELVDGDVYLHGRINRPS